MQNKISVIVPVYREEKNIIPFLDRLVPVLEKLELPYEIIFCMDPSPDQTEAVIMDAANENPAIKLIVFSRRFGQPAATLAGLHLSDGDYVVVIDVDLQDPPELIRELYEELTKGYEVVYATRRSRKGETLVKRMIAYLGYKAIHMLSDVQIPRDTGDYRIMTRRVVDNLKLLNESHGFLRGLVAYLGFKQSHVMYDRDPRFEGKGHYNRLTGSIKIGLNGLISFSSKPLQIMSLVGGFTAGFSFLLGLWYVIQKIAGFELSPGLPTTVLVVTFFSGVQLLSLGLLGEYIGRIYDEVKRRPPYIIDRIVTGEVRND